MTKRNYKSIKKVRKVKVLLDGKKIVRYKKVSTNRDLKIDKRSGETVVKNYNLLGDHRPPVGSKCGRCGSIKDIAKKCPNTVSYQDLSHEAIKYYGKKIPLKYGNRTKNNKFRVIGEDILL